MEGPQLLLVLVPMGFFLGASASVFLMGRSQAANVVGPAFAVASCALAGLASAIGLARTEPVSVHFAWQVPLGDLLLGLDPLSAWFLAPVAILGGLAAVYGQGYLAASAGRKRLGGAWAAFNLLLGGMATVTLARNGTLFLMAWEVMSLAAWFLVAFEHEREEVRPAAWIYLVATHLGVAALLVLFLLLRRASGGSADFTVVQATEVPVTALLVLALVGFGAKAGLVPFHVWLPEAHAAAPSHVSAVMSGVLVKMGIYGILRILLILGAPPPWFPVVMIGLGLTGGLLGIMAALGQRDMKRTLAYSTIENVGIVALGIGTGAWGWNHSDHVVAGLGFAGALLHVWNHAAMKGLLFLGAGSVLHGTGTKDVERLGGLMRHMPWTGTLLAVGAVAISGLPPLNGFVGEWLLYLGLIVGGQAGEGASSAGFLGAVGVLSLVGALTAASFARLVGIVTLGSARDPERAPCTVGGDGQPLPSNPTPPHEAGTVMLVPMVALAALCVAGGVGAPLLLHAAAPVVGQLAPGALLPTVSAVSRMNLLVWAAILAGTVGLAIALRGRPSSRAATWGCGYPAPDARMQYTGRAFADLGETSLVPTMLRPRSRPGLVHGLFPGPERRVTDYADATLRGLYEPFFRRWAIRFARVRRIQQGKTWASIAYIGGAVVIALAWSALRDGGVR